MTELYQLVCYSMCSKCNKKTKHIEKYGEEGYWRCDECGNKYKNIQMNKEKEEELRRDIKEQVELISETRKIIDHICCEQANYCSIAHEIRHLFVLYDRVIEIRAMERMKKEGTLNQLYEG